LDRHDKVEKQETLQEDIVSLESATSTIGYFGTIVFFIVIVEIILLVGLNLYQSSRVDTLEGQIANVQQELGSAELRGLNQQVSEVISGAEKLNTVLANKADWSKFYASLNAVTPKNVRIIGLTINENGSFKADGETDTLSSLAQALVAWEQGAGSITTPFSSVKLSSNGYTTDGGSRRVTFSISGQINTGSIR
jgi:hypothetical protein